MQAESAAGDRGRRQLQALVRLRSENGRSDPTPALRFPRPHHRASNDRRECPGQDGPLLGAAQRHRPRTQRDFHLESALESNRTGPTDVGPKTTAAHVGVHNRIGLWFPAQPNEKRLSCAAVLWCSQT